MKQWVNWTEEQKNISKKRKKKKNTPKNIHVWYCKYSYTGDVSVTPLHVVCFFLLLEN